MRRKTFFVFFSTLVAIASAAQKPAEEKTVDTAFTDYDVLFNELDALLDSLTGPRTFTLINVGVTNEFFSYVAKSDLQSITKKQTVFSPSISYYAESGLGISAEASIISDRQAFNPYQFSLTGSYDYLQKRSFITGLAFTHFFTKADLPFYTTPLNNEVIAYFTSRKFWLKPSVSVSYGWGSRNSLKNQEAQIAALQIARHGFTQVQTQEHANDFNIVGSLRHDFYWLNVASKKDYIRLTPQLSFSSGTHQFGFNQTSNTYASVRRTGPNVLYRTQNVSLDNNLNFQPLSVSAHVKAEYSFGKFFIQPQAMCDYYFPAPENKLSTAWIVNAGVLF